MNKDTAPSAQIKAEELKELKACQDTMRIQQQDRIKNIDKADHAFESEWKAISLPNASTDVENIY